jgi:hypothetical protein
MIAAASTTTVVVQTSRSWVDYLIAFGTVGSAGAAAVAAWKAGTAAKASRVLATLETERRAEEREAAKHAHPIPTPKWDAFPTLTIVNTGPAAARDVVLKMTASDGKQVWRFGPTGASPRGRRAAVLRIPELRGLRLIPRRVRTPMTDEA